MAAALPITLVQVVVGAVALLMLAVVALLIRHRGFAARTWRPFARGVLGFSYPANWKLETERQAGGMTITIEGWGSCFVVVDQLAAGDDTRLDAWAGRFVGAFVEEIDQRRLLKSAAGAGRDWQPVEAAIGGRPTVGVENDVELRAFGVPVPHRLQFFEVASASHRIMVALQAATEDWAKAMPIFDEILESVRIGIDA